MGYKIFNVTLKFKGIFVAETVIIIIEKATHKNWQPNGYSDFVTISHHISGFQYCPV